MNILLNILIVLIIKFNQIIIVFSIILIYFAGSWLWWFLFVVVMSMDLSDISFSGSFNSVYIGFESSTYKIIINFDFDFSIPFKHAQLRYISNENVIEKQPSFNWKMSIISFSYLFTLSNSFTCNCKKNFVIIHFNVYKKNTSALFFTLAIFIFSLSFFIFPTFSTEK